MDSDMPAANRAPSNAGSGSDPMDAGNVTADTADVDADVVDDFGEVLEEARRKATAGRVYDSENERIRIEWVRAYAEAAAEYRKLVTVADTSE